MIKAEKPRKTLKICMTPALLAGWGRGPASPDRGVLPIY